MSIRLKQYLPTVAVIAFLIALAGFFATNKKLHTLRSDTGETRQTVDAGVADLLTMRPVSIDDPLFRQSVDKFSRTHHVWYVWLISVDGRIVFSNAQMAERGSVEELALDETRRVLSEMPEGFLSAQQRIALLAASAIQREGEHNDILRHMIRPVRGSGDVDLGFVGVAYEASASAGSFPGYGYAAGVMAIPFGLAVYWMSLAWWVYLDARERRERAWVWAMFVLLGNLVALFAYLLTRHDHSQSTEESAADLAVG
jgi:hypothetical protein